MRADTLSKRRQKKKQLLWYIPTLFLLNVSSTSASNYERATGIPPRAPRGTGLNTQDYRGIDRDRDRDRDYENQREKGQPGTFPDRNRIDRQQSDPRSFTKPQPPPPPSLGTPYTPIHYEFRKESPPRPQTAKASGDDEFPMTFNIPTESEYQQNDIPMQQSPRQDAITKYMSQAKGRLIIRASCTAVGYALGAILGKSLLSNATFLGTITAFTFLFLSFLRSSYGELVRALGLAWILAMKQTSSIRKQYPTWPHIKASVGLRERQPFPPTDNPWTYKDDDFSMIQTMIAMILVGTTIGGNLPIIPSWIGGLLGAAIFGAATTARHARGDVVRTMGARLVALMYVVLDVTKELKLVSKTMVVTSNILDKVFILDRKHRIKDKLVAGATFLYDQVTNMVKQTQNDGNEPDQKSQRNSDDRRRRDEGDGWRDQRERDEYQAQDSFSRSRRNDRRDDQ